jgi:hypothetical protein
VGAFYRVQDRVVRLCRSQIGGRLHRVKNLPAVDQRIFRLQ